MRRAYLSLRNACNARCPMCLSWRSSAALDDPVALRVVDAVAADGFERLVLTGGEFVEHTGAWAVAERAVARGLELAYITNGTALLAEYRAFFEVGTVAEVIYSRDFADGTRHAEFRGLPDLDDVLDERLPELRSAGVRIACNTVLMPANADGLLRFRDLAFWSAIDRWQLIPVKGPMAAGWTAERAAVARDALETLRADDDGPVIVGPPAEALGPDATQALRDGRYAEAMVGRTPCRALEDMVYIDATGHALPCNSIAWEYRDVVGFGDVGTADPAAILANRRERVAAGNARDPQACYACDPLNLQRNLVAAETEER